MQNKIDTIWFSTLTGGQLGVHPENAKVYIKDGPTEEQSENVLLHIFSQKKNYEINYLSNKGGISQLQAAKV